jgi:hypothetical protein
MFLMMQILKKKEVVHVAKMLGFLGENQKQNESRKILALEINVKDLTEKRQKKIIQPNDRADLQKLTPS